MISSSLLTIEYDVRDDLDDVTDVFKLQTASLGTVERLISIRRPDVSSVDARTVAEFSDGNARIRPMRGIVVLSEHCAVAD